MNSIHISTARKIIDSGDPIDLKVWKKDGSVMELKRCVGLRYNFRNAQRHAHHQDPRVAADPHHP